MTSEWLRRTFGRVRAEAIPGAIDWVAPRDANGKSGDMAERLNEDRSSWPDIVPTMQRLFVNLLSGAYERRGDEILQKPALGFACWCSDFSALREQLRGVKPKAAKPAPTGPTYELLATGGRRA